MLQKYIYIERTCMLRTIIQLFLKTGEEKLFNVHKYASTEYTACNGRITKCYGV